ncbi:MAG: carbon-nitrogen hydrolase family protein [Gammaproteobacteria bacterium]
MFKIAAIQLNSTDKVTENLEQSAQLIRQAATQGAQLVVLPEMFAIMGHTPEDKLQVKEPLGSGPIQDFLATQAREHKIWLIGGTIPIAAPNSNKVYAANLLINDQGQCVAQYNKIHLFDVILSQTLAYKESTTTLPGSELVVADTPFGKLGLSVCYDVRFPEQYRTLGAQGAQILVVPSAFTFPTGQAHWEVLLRARAIENFCYVIAANQVGVQADNRRSFGHSMIIDPWGKVLANAGEQEPMVIVAEIDLNYVKECRARIPSAT